MMKTKILKKLLLLFVSILGLSYYLFFISGDILYSKEIIPEKNIPISANIISNKVVIPVSNIPVEKHIISNKVIAPISENIISEFPVRLKIPKIAIDTEVINVGITPTGTLDTPKDIKSVGLYNLGPVPGEEGSAVIDGHYGWINKKPAVFNNLSKLQKGDKIFFHDKEGNIITFIVNKINIYDENEATTDIFNSNDGKSHLNIITCEGVRDKSKKSYNNRLVVFSDKLIE